jgi:hypothetical protein
MLSFTGGTHLNIGNYQMSWYGCSKYHPKLLCVIWCNWHLQDHQQLVITDRSKFPLVLSNLLNLPLTRLTLICRFPIWRVNNSTPWFFWLRPWACRYSFTVEPQPLHKHMLRTSELFSLMGAFIGKHMRLRKHCFWWFFPQNSGLSRRIERMPQLFWITSLKHILIRKSDFSLKRTEEVPKNYQSTWIAPASLVAAACMFTSEAPGFLKFQKPRSCPFPISIPF